MVAEAHQVSAGGAGGRKQALHLHGGDHVGVLGIGVAVESGRVEGFEAGGQDHGPGLEGHGFGPLAVGLQGHGPGLAGRHALVALAADGAFQAAVRLGAGGLFVVAELNFVEVGGAGFGGQHRHRLAHGVGQPVDGHVLDRGPVGLAPGGQILAADEAVDGNRRLLSGADGFHHRGRAGDRIAAGEDVRVRSLQGDRVDLHRTPVTQGAGALVGQTGPVRLLADGGNHRIDFDDKLGAGHRHGPPPSAGIRGAQFHADAFDGRDAAVFGDHPGRVGEGHQLDALFVALFDFFRVGRHLLDGAPVDDKRLLGAGAQGGAHAVHGHVAAADHRHPVAQMDAVAQVDLAQKVDPGKDPLIILALDAQPLALLGADADEKGLVALIAQLADGEILADFHPGLELHAQVLDDLNLRLDDIAGQPVGGNPHAEHAAEDRQFLENGHPVALDGQKIGAGQPGRSGPHDGDLLFAQGFFDRHVGGAAGPVRVGQKAVQVHDPQGLVHRLARTGAFARMGADPSADPGKGVVLLE